MRYHLCTIGDEEVGIHHTFWRNVWENIDDALYALYKTKQEARSYKSRNPNEHVFIFDNDEVLHRERTDDDVFAMIVIDETHPMFNVTVLSYDDPHDLEPDLSNIPDEVITAFTDAATVMINKIAGI